MRELLLRLWGGKLLIAFCSLAGVVAASGVVLSTARVYRSTMVVTIMPSGSSASGQGLQGGLGQLAALAGVSTGSAVDRGEYIAYLSGRSFTSRFLESVNVSQLLFPDKWSNQRRNWKEGVTPPTLEDMYLRFDEEIRSIKEDKVTGLISISIDTSDPARSAELANKLVQQANEELRVRAKTEAQRSLEFLKEQLNKADIVELKQTIFSLMETQITNIMLADVRPEYAFKVIDPALPSDLTRYIRPREAATVFLGGIVGLILGCFVAEAREALKRFKSKARSEV
jgi:uncharacterized protein involved in exopolysaccharide biosynthesis